MLLTTLRFLTAHALSALAEPRCCACEAPVPLETVFCGPCATTLVEVDAGGDPRRVEAAAVAYGGALRDAIGRVKSGGRDDLARPLGALLCRLRAPVALARPGVLVPVPSHASRLASRGYEPSALLGRALAEAVGAPLLVDGLVKTAPSPAQAGLDRRARLSNLAGSLRCQRPGVLRGVRVVLVDDVRTTGATLAACTAALEEAGAHVLGHAVLAAAEP